MDPERVGTGDFSYDRGTLDCPAQLDPSGHDQDAVEIIEACGCCSFDDGSTVKTPDDCRYRVGNGKWYDCDCHNTPIVYGSCLSKRNHGACPYGMKG